MPRFSVVTKNHQHSLHRVHPCETCGVRAISACSALAAGERLRLASIMTTMALSPRRLIFVETEPAENLFNVTGGVVTIYKMMSGGRRQITRFLFPGDF